MRVSMWIIFAIFFAFVESIPITNENHSNTYNFTQGINFGLSTFFRFTHLNKSLFENDETIQLKNDTNSGTLHNVIMEFELKLPSHLEFLSNDSFTMYGDLPMKYLHARLQNTNLYIISHPKKFSYMINQALSSYDKFTANYPDIKQYEIKHYDRDEFDNDPILDPKIQAEIEINLQNALHEIMHQNKLGRNNFTQWFLKNFGQFLQNEQERYYFIDTITTTNYTLKNVTIRGLWNIEIISLNALNRKAYPEIKMSQVRGSLLMNTVSNPQESLELNFQADNVYLLIERYSEKIKVSLRKCSVINTEMSKSLADDEWKSIVTTIESSIANSIESYWKN